MMYKCIIEVAISPDNYLPIVWKEANLTGRWKIIRRDESKYYMMYFEVEYEMSSKVQEYATIGKWWWKSSIPLPREKYKKREWIQENNIRFTEEYINICGE